MTDDLNMTIICAKLSAESISREK